MVALYILVLLLTLGVVFLLVPRIVFPLQDIPGTFLDRTVAGFLLMAAVSMVAMYVLWLFGMLEGFALIALLAAVWWFLKGRHRDNGGRMVGVAQRFFNFSDRVEQEGARDATGQTRDDTRTKLTWRLRNYLREVRDRITDPGVLLVCFVLLAILAVSAWLRFQRALVHPELVPQDSYLALYWTKSITDGNLLVEGVYPQGGYLWTSLLDHFYLFDTYSFIRFVGPLMNVVELIALYWATSRATRNRAAGLAATAVFGLFAGHPMMFVDWSRQIGSMTQEFATAFAVVGLVYGAYYMAHRRRHDLWLAGAAIFVALTTHTVTLIPLALGFAVILLVGLATASWTRQTLRRMVVVGIAAAALGHIFIPLGLLRGRGFALSYFQYNPTNYQGFGNVAQLDSATTPGEVGAALSSNAFFQLGLVGALLAIGVGAALALRRNANGAVLAGMGGAALVMMLFYDLVAVRFGLLFRVRVGYVVGELQTLAMGLGLGALAIGAAQLVNVSDPLWDRYRSQHRGARAGLELATLLLSGILVLALWPAQSAVARVAGPSGYPQATEVALDIIRNEDRLTYTFVGASEQFQEVAFNGFHVEAWVFAKDIEFSDARDPSYEIPIPTNTVYIFAEKDAFAGPQAQFWFGPTEEYYRTEQKRERIMQRIVEWSETYRRHHDDMDVVYDDEQLRVYEVERTVSLERAERSEAFEDYTWLPGQYFDDDGDITADEVVPNPDAPAQRTDGRDG